MRGARPASDAPPAPLKLLIFLEASSVNGAARSLLNFCDHHASLGTPLAISVATFERLTPGENEQPNAFIEAVRSRGIPAYIIPERHRFDRQVLQGIRDLVARLAPDIIQTNNVKSHFLLRTSGVVNRTLWIAFHHGYTTTDFKMKVYNQLDRWSLRSAKQVVTFCGAFRKQLMATAGLPGKKITVVHNSGAVAAPLSAETIAGLRSKFGIAQEEAVLLAVGRLSHEKGHADLIEATALLRAAHPDMPFKLLLVGDGPEHPRLAAQVERLGLQSHVILAGNQSDVLPFYSLADVFVLPSHSEGSPHVIFEAMGAGVPIVASRVGGIPEVLTDGVTALLPPARNPEALARAVDQLLASKQTAERYASEAKKLLESTYSHEIYARTLLGIYANLAGAKP